jgi:hypothetical protein
LLPHAPAVGFLGFVDTHGGDFSLDDPDEQLLAQFGVQLGEDILVLLEEVAGVFAAKSVYSALTNIRSQ